MLYVQLDVNWCDNPKIIRAGWELAGMHAAIMCLSKRQERDGWVEAIVLRRMGISDDHLAALFAHGLIERESEHVRPSDWLERNPSQAAINAKREAKAAAARKGNHDRWSHPGDVATCPICNPKAQVVAPCESQTVAEHRTPTSHSSESDAAIAPGDHASTAHTPEQREANLAAIHELKSRRTSA